MASVALQTPLEFDLGSPDRHADAIVPHTPSSMCVLGMGTLRCGLLLGLRQEVGVTWVAAINFTLQE